jgi:uncharacterized phage infection (PIP) family protein YhgE
VLFDVDRELITTVSHEGSEYRLYTYENRLDAASGVEVWTNEGRVTAAETVDAVFETYAWRRTIETLFDRRERLGTAFTAVLDRAETIDAQIQTVRPAIDTVFEQVDRLDGITVSADAGLGSGVQTFSAWDILTQVYPTIGALASGARSVQDRLDDWNESVTATQSALPALRSSLETADDPAQVETERARRQVDDARSALDALLADTQQLQRDVDELEQNAEETLSTLDQSTEQIVEQVASNADIPDAAVDFFANRADEILGGVRAAVDALFGDVIDLLLSPITQLETETSDARETVTVEPTARERSDSLVADWERRRTAESTVTIPIAGGSLLGVLLLVSAWVRPNFEPGDVDE